MGHLGPKRGQNEVFGHLFVQNALDFADYAYYDWEQLYLRLDSGQSYEKNFAGPKMGHLGLKRGQNEVFGLFLHQNALDFDDSAYYDQE